MNTVREVCEKLEIQKEVAKKVIAFDEQFDYSMVEDAMNRLFDRSTWEGGIAEIKGVIGEDADGVKILTCMLKCAIKTYQLYQSHGVDEQIYVDSLKAFTRFVGEHKVSYGTYGFDRYGWATRQIAMQLLRIGQLEYEMDEIDGEKVISLHIPSDASLKKEGLRKSYEEARVFFDTKFPEYKSARMVCHSWLLSPALKDVLPEGSNILNFQKNFVIESAEYEQMDCLEWVFKNPKMELKDLPENTSLQRNLKKYLLDGKNVGTAFGHLVDEPFL